MKNIYQRLMKIQSDTGTHLEVNIENELFDILSSFTYLKANPQHLMKDYIEDDPFGRFNLLAFYQGKSPSTVILLHHHDAVDLSVYGEMSAKALGDEIRDYLKTLELDEDTKKDLDDPKWLFGRGSCDMKSGASMQLATFRDLSEDETFDGSILLISVADEENLSAGMRQAMKMMGKLKEDHKLDYKVVINSEPTSMMDDGYLLSYEGTVGKIMPVVYAKG